MALTFGEVKALVAEYAGRGGSSIDSPQTEMFAKQVLQLLLFRGETGSIRRFDFVAQNGCIALPQELETPLQVKINGTVGTVWNQWMEFHSVNAMWEPSSCSPAFETLQVQADPAYTVYEIPPGGAYLSVLSTAEESKDAHIIIKGTDVTGREINTYHNGELIIGEKLTIQKSVRRQGQVLFGKITGIYKSQTKGYVQLWGLNAGSGADVFLGDYSPLQQRPQFTKARILGCGALNSVSIIGRIRLKERYVDNDLVPFDDINAIKLAAQKAHAEDTNNIGVANYKDQALRGMIEDSAGYKRVSPGTPVNVFAPTSGGAVRNLMPRAVRGFGWWR